MNNFNPQMMKTKMDFSLQLTENGQGLLINILLKGDSALDSLAKRKKLVSHNPTPAALDTTTNFSVDGLFIREGYRFVKINFKNILFLEACGSYTLVHSRNKKYTLARNLTRCCKDLTHPFMRIHRSYTVNLENIDSFSETFVFFSDTKIPVSEPYKKELLRHFNCI